MDEQYEQLRSTYQELSDNELLDLSAEPESLTPLAGTVLAGELARRGLFAAPREEQVGAESRQLVTLRSYRDLSEAIVARSMLESAGIPVYLQNENLVRLDWQVSNGIGGVRLQVERGDAAAAQELLSEPLPESIEFEANATFEQPRCPACGSLDIKFEGASRAAAVTSLWVLGLPAPMGQKSWRCNACEARWNETPD